MSTEQKCKIEGCKRPYRAKGYCTVHFNKWRRGELAKKARYKTCTQEGCRKASFRNGICETHFNEKLGKKNPPVAAAPEAAPSPEAAPTTTV